VSKLKLLFVCTANINRSRTAEDLLKGSDRYEVQSAGIKKHDQGKQVVTQELVDWADIIFVMDEDHDRHASILQERFGAGKEKVCILCVPDIYAKGDKVLAELLRSRLTAHGIIFR